MKKRMFTLLLAAVMVISFAACSEKDDKKAVNKTNSALSKNGFVVEAEDSVKLGTPDRTLDPKKIYENLEYTPEMFYGDYRLLGGEDAVEKYGKDSNYSEFTQKGKEYLLSEIPYRIEAGRHTISHVVSNIKDYNWARLTFLQQTDSGNYLYTLMCAYEIDGNTVTFRPLDSLDTDMDNNKISYIFTEYAFEYEFAFSGRSLTLSTQENSLTLTTGLDITEDDIYIREDHYISPKSEVLDDIEQFGFYYETGEDDTNFYIETFAGESIYNGVGLIEENGLFTFTVPFEAGTKTYQFVYFLCRNDGFILTDGEKTYYFNDNYSDRNMNVLNDFITEDQTGKLESLSESQLAALVEKKEDLMQDLAAAFKDADIAVTVDEKNAELAIDSSVLFGGDSAVVTAEGKEFLNKFIKVYTSVIFNSKYDGFISETLVEGHTAPVAGSTYESGLPLSEERANNVKDYCLSSETGVDTAKLASALTAVGCSNSKPIYGSDGKVDMAASRRVSFRFLVNIG